MGVPSWHFAEPSCYRYDRKCPRVVTSSIVYSDPPKADSELRNAHELMGNIVVVERGGRVHFPDIVRRVLTAGAVGCIFIERPDALPPSSSLFDGFHSSGRQRVSIPIVLLAAFHAEQLLRDRPARVSIELISGESAIKQLCKEDLVVAAATAARAGEVDVLKHILYSDTSGLIRERIPKSVALCDAAENGHVDCLELLHGFGISLDEQKPNGTSALMVACSVGNVEAARALLMFGANVDLEDVHGLTALMIAARDGRSECLKLLIRKGAQINLSRNRNRGTTALHIAARGGQEECVSILLQAGAILDISSPNSTTALMEAARAGNLGCVKQLVAAGARIDARDREGHTAEALAKASGHAHIEDFLRERAESDSVKDHRRQIEEAIADPESTLADLLSIAEQNHTAVDSLHRELTRDTKYAEWLEQPHIIFEALRLLTMPMKKCDAPLDTLYGRYKTQHFCCELLLWYPRRIFEIECHRKATVAASANSNDALDHKKSSGYLKVLFSFLCSSGELDDVQLILFCKVLDHYLLKLQLGKLLLHFLAHDGQFVVPWLVNHIGLDSVRDIMVWLLYSDMTDEGQLNVRQCGIFDCSFSRLLSWQRTLSWGVGTPYQRDSIENICLLVNYIIYPPAIFMMGNVPTFVDNTDHSFPLITDQHFPLRHNELLKSLLIFCSTSDLSFGTLIDLGFAEIFRQSTQNCALIVHEGGTLSIAMMVMSTLGYHKRKRDLTGIESHLQAVKSGLLESLFPRVPKFVRLCHAVITGDVCEARLLVDVDKCTDIKLAVKGSPLLYIISFLKRCVFLQDPKLNAILAQEGLMPCLLRSYGAQPTNNLLHHEVTDVIRFVLLDPDQKRPPSCPLLNSLFAEPANILDFVTRSYDKHVQYKGHLTTIANSIFTLTNTPVHKNEDLTCQEIVRAHTCRHENWTRFEAVLAEQNLLEMQPLGQRNAPLCDGCLKLKEHAVEYVSSTLATEVKFSGYVETIFSGAASHYCKVNVTEDFITGFLYKKDKIHDHIPIPEPTRVSSFIQFPVPMPFHALTFTVTYFGLCRKCDKLWYCDTLQSANWATRMKWVIPTSVRKWYSFGASEGPGSGAHGIQFSTKGYKSFIVLTDTWGRQEQWMHALEEAILGLSSQAARRMDAESAMAIEIDNEVDASEFDLKKLHSQMSGKKVQNEAAKSTTRPSRREKKRQDTRRRSNTISESLSEMEKLEREFSSDDDDSDSDSDSVSSGDSNGSRRSSTRKPRPASAGFRIATENALKSGKPLPVAPPVKKTSSMRRSSGSEANLTKLELRQFQEDAKRYTEILNALKMASPPTASSSRNATRSPVLSSPVKNGNSPPLDAHSCRELQSDEERCRVESAPDADAR
ncbi:hypothetical protein PINS_up005694 [Pythium insidiosum]|nr:hypothetical protein PINS_up005694 [Pythium insidiosum]